MRKRRYAKAQKEVKTFSGEEYTVERYHETFGFLGDSLLIINVYHPWKSWLFGRKRGLVYSIKAGDEHEVQSVSVGYQASFIYAAEKYEETLNGGKR